MPDEPGTSPDGWRADIDCRLAAFGVPPGRRTEIVDEIAQHLEDRYDELKAEGRSDAEARRLVLADLEGHRLASEVARTERVSTMEPPVLGAVKRSVMGNVSQDVKYAFRSMRQSPLFTGIVIGTLALAIGANVAIFTVTDAAMLRPSPTRRSIGWWPWPRRRARGRSCPSRGRTSRTGSPRTRSSSISASTAPRP